MLSLYISAARLFFLDELSPPPVRLDYFFHPKYKNDAEKGDAKIKTLPRKLVCKTIPNMDHTAY